MPVASRTRQSGAAKPPTRGWRRNGGGRYQSVPRPPSAHRIRTPCRTSLDPETLTLPAAAAVQLLKSSSARCGTPRATAGCRWRPHASYAGILDRKSVVSGKSVSVSVDLGGRRITKKKNSKKKHTPILSEQNHNNNI